MGVTVLIERKEDQQGGLRWQEYVLENAHFFGGSTWRIRLKASRNFRWELSSSTRLFPPALSLNGTPISGDSLNGPGLPQVSSEST
jgi:hypothetical protein